MKRITAAILAAMLLLPLSACAGVTDPNAGIYECTELSADGISLAPDEVFGSGANQIGLKSNGSGIWVADGKEYKITWKLDGDVFTVMQDGDSFIGTLSDGVMTVDYSGVECVFLRADAAARLAKAQKKPSADAAETSAQSFWNGEWYGWWIIETGRGGYEQQSYSWWDCCADIGIDADGRGSITVWDEQGERQSPLAVVNLEAGEGSNDAETLISTDGQFNGEDIGYGGWVISPGEYTQLSEPLIIIDGDFIDGEDSGSGFTYYIYLRPWGTEWGDIEREDPSQLPRGYYDWYLPLIEAGETAPDMIALPAAASAVSAEAVPESENGQD